MSGFGYRRSLSAAALCAGALVLPSCGNAGQTGGAQSPLEADAEQASTAQMGEQADIAAMLPNSLLESNELRVGVSLSNPPSAYYDQFTGELSGFDVDIASALGTVLGTPAVTFVPVAFPHVLSRLGSDYEIAAAFTAVTAQRMSLANFVTYAESGSAYAVKPNNPHGFDPFDPCGQRIAVQTNTVQEEQLESLAAECIGNEESPIEIVAHSEVNQVMQALSEDAAVAIYWDSLVLRYFASQPGARLTQVGDTSERSSIGISISTDDPQLTVAVQAAMQYLMDQGVIASILAEYGASEAALSTSAISSLPN